MILGIPIIGDFLSKSLFVCRHHLYDTTDRLHFLFTAYFLAFLVALVGAKQHFGNPIDCMVPKEINDIGPWRSYIHNFCLFYGTYRYKFNETHHEFDREKVGNAVNYYQWVPFFLCFQMFCFILPHWLWTWMQKLLYLDMEMIVDYTSGLLLEKRKEEHKKLSDLIDYTYDHFKYRRQHKSGFFSGIYMHSSFACFLYMLTKIIFLSNVMIQLKLTSLFLGFDSWTWGFSNLQSYIHMIMTRPSRYDLIYGQNVMNYPNFENFPILVACDYQSATTIGGILNSTVQCIIPLNIVNEKVFLILWLWFVLLTVISMFGTLSWLLQLRDRKSSELLIFRNLKDTMDFSLEVTSFGYGTHYPDHRFDFVHRFLGSDGILLVRFMKMKNGPLKTQEVINGLFEKYCKDFCKPIKPLLRGEKVDYSEVNFGENDGNDYLHHRV